MTIKTSKKIMIVEDDDNLREMFAIKMKLAGYDVQEASDGAKAVNLIKKDKPDLVLVDILLPRKDGFQIMEEIKNSPDQKTSSTPFMVISNLSNEEDIQEARKLGAVEYMIKAKVTPKDIVESVNKVLTQG